jgi:signal transduction histidine kinase
MEKASTGLGLSICKEIISAHKGKIWAVNNPRGGSIFSFLLPVEQDIRSVHNNL